MRSIASELLLQLL